MQDNDGDEDWDVDAEIEFEAEGGFDEEQEFDEYDGSVAHLERLMVDQEGCSSEAFMDWVFLVQVSQFLVVTFHGDLSCYLLFVCRTKFLHLKKLTSRKISKTSSRTQSSNISVRFMLA